MPEGVDCRWRLAYVVVAGRRQAGAGGEGVQVARLDARRRRRPHGVLHRQQKTGSATPVPGKLTRLGAGCLATLRGQESVRDVCGGMVPVARPVARTMWSRPGHARALFCRPTPTSPRLAPLTSQPPRHPSPLPAPAAPSQHGHHLQRRRVVVDVHARLCPARARAAAAADAGAAARRRHAAHAVPAPQAPVRHRASRAWSLPSRPPSALDSVADAAVRCRRRSTRPPTQRSSRRSTRSSATCRPAWRRRQARA